MDNLENLEVKEVKRNSFKLEKDILSFGSVSLDLNTLDFWASFGLLEKYTFVYGIKQACQDHHADVKVIDGKAKLVEKSFQLFAEKNLDFLPNSCKNLTKEEKETLKLAKAEEKKEKEKIKKEKDIKELVEQMISGGMSEEMAISIAKKTFK